MSFLRRPTPSSFGEASRGFGKRVDIRMRRGHRADFKTIWAATLQTVWDDLPDDERRSLDRATWEKEFRRKLMPYVEGGRTEAWIAEDPAGMFLGYLLLGEGGGFLTSEPHGFVFDVWVAPEHRGKGVGKFLMSWAVDWGRSKGYRKIKLEVADSNARARHIYEELGFRYERHYMGKNLG
jgi:ribosomal protein S18 acetylase RimI-like enzyme